MNTLHPVMTALQNLIPILVIFIVALLRISLNNGRLL